MGSLKFNKLSRVNARLKSVIDELTILESASLDESYGLELAKMSFTVARSFKNVLLEIEILIAMELKHENK